MHGTQTEPVLYAYLAGVFDGEGCIQVERSHRQVEPGRHQRRIVYIYTLSVAMTNLPVLEIFKKTFGGSIYKRTFSPPENKSSIYRWRVTSRPQTQRVLKALVPYMVVKKKQAQFMLDVIDAWKSFKGGSRKIHRISDEEMLRREESYVIMRKFNAVGGRATTEREDAERRSDSLSWLETVRGGVEELPSPVAIAIGQ